MLRLATAMIGVSHHTLALRCTRPYYSPRRYRILHIWGVASSASADYDIVDGSILSTCRTGHLGGVVCPDYNKLGAAACVVLIGTPEQVQGQ